MTRNRLVVLLSASLLSFPLAAQDFLDSAKAPFPVAGTLQGIRLEQVASGLASVTGITHAGDSRLFVVLREGRILIRGNNGFLVQPFLDIRSLVNTGGEGGLLSVAFHPRFAENGFLFVNYTNSALDTVIARYHVSTDPNRADPGSARTLLVIDQPFDNHKGGQIQFGPNGYLYIGMGDGGAAFDPSCRAQREDTLLGKMLRLDVDQNTGAAPFYGIPSDNPFRGPGGLADEVWALGLRNPWRFSFDRQTGDLWIADVGQGQREEVDFQPASSRGGENYGWKPMEGTLCATSDACPASTPPCNSPAYTLPVLEYGHDAKCSITGGYVYRGSRLPQIRGMYFFGDFCTGEIWAAAREGSGFTVRALSDRRSQLTTFGEDRDGEIYLATLGGALVRITGDTVAPAAPDTVGLFEPPPSRFHLKTANTANSSEKLARFGPRRSGWTPLAGDWDGNGTSTPGFWDPRAETFRLKSSLQGGAADVLVHVDAPSANVLPVTGDWNGDGRDTVGLYEVTTGIFYLKDSFQGSGFDRTVDFGPQDRTWLPVAGDFNANGTDDLGFFDPGESLFILPFIFRPDGPPVEVQVGPRGRNALPVVGDWNGDGQDGVGVYDPAMAIFRLKNSLESGNPNPEVQFRFGPRRGGWWPLAGAW